MTKRVLTLMSCLAAAVTALPAQDTTPAPEPKKAIGEISNYQLQPGDVIQVRVFQEIDLDRETRVSQDYTIMLPLIGEVSVRNKSPRQVEADVRALYDRDFIVNPQVNISVVQYAPRTVSMVGMFNSPGPVPFPPEEGLRLVDAIARAGGFSRLARPSKMTLTRKMPDGTTQVFPINGDELIRGKLTEDWFLQRDDVVFVPETIY